MGSGSNEITFTNAAGKSIVGIASKSTTESAYGANLMKTGDTIKADEQFKLLINTPAGTTANTGSATVSVKGMVDIQLTFADGSIVALRQIDPSSIKEATIKTADGFGYIEYTNSDGNTVSTLESTKALKAQEDAAAQAAAAAAAQAQADAEAAANAASVDDSSSYGSSGSSSGNDYSTGSSSQGQEGCLGGNVGNFLK